jgi:ribonuclease HII
MQSTKTERDENMTNTIHVREALDYFTMDETAVFDASSIHAAIVEAGGTCLVGPLAICVVVLSNRFQSPYFPSKTKSLPPEVNQSIKTEALSDAIYTRLYYVDQYHVDEFGIFACQSELWQRCVHDLRDVYPEISIGVSGISHVHRDVEGLIKIANAEEQDLSSFVAGSISKTFLYEQLEEIDAQFPGFHFLKHKGYPTHEHYMALKKYGIQDYHRAHAAQEFLDFGPTKIFSKDIHSRIVYELRMRNGLRPLYKGGDKKYFERLLYSSYETLRNFELRILFDEYEKLRIDLLPHLEYQDIC